MTDPRDVQESIARSTTQLRVWTVAALTVYGLITLATLVVILMAVVPGWPINRQGQQSTAKAVGSINEVSVLAAFCAKQEETLPAIRACVVAGLEELSSPPPKESP